MTFCVVEFSDFGLCNMLCFAGQVCGPVRSTWGTSLGEDEIGARAKILNTKVVRWARTDPIVQRKKVEVLGAVQVMPLSNAPHQFGTES